jgi:pyruvoyl-dependent arginine decarboxylase (PvlArgDC)
MSSSACAKEDRTWSTRELRRQDAAAIAQTPCRHRQRIRTQTATAQSRAHGVKTKAKSAAVLFVVCVEC